MLICYKDRITFNAPFPSSTSMLKATQRSYEESAGKRGLLERLRVPKLCCLLGREQNGVSSITFLDMLRNLEVKLFALILS